MPRRLWIRRNRTEKNRSGCARCGFSGIFAKTIALWGEISYNIPKNCGIPGGKYEKAQRAVFEKI